MHGNPGRVPSPQSRQARPHVRASGNRRVSAFAAATPYLLMLVTAFLMFAETTDDPFITFRYAANLVAGHGPVFNPGEHVEGFSSPLHLLICAAALKVFPRVGMLIKLKVVSFLFGCAYLFLTGTLARVAGLGRADRILAQTLVALNVNFAIAAGNALETTLFGVVLVWAVTLFVQESTRRSGWSSSVVLFLAVLCRPDAFAVFALLAAVRGWQAIQARFPRRDAAKWASAFCLLALALTCARLIYYHAPLPNTYYAKHGPLWPSIKLGTESLAQSLSPVRLEPSTFRAGHRILTRTLQPVVAPIFWGLALLGFSSSRRGTGGAVGMALGASVFAFCIAAWRCGGDWMFGCRFLAPALSMLAVLQCLGLRAIADWRARRAASHSNGKTGPAPRFGPGRAAVVAIWACALIASPWKPWSSAHFATSDEDLLVHNTSELGPLWVGVGRYMESDLPKGAVVVYSEMGYGPYKNLDKRFIDIRGLTDPEIARLPAKFKRFIGVWDPNWNKDSDDELHQILTRRKFDVIIDIFPPGGGSEVVFGKYVRRTTLQIARTRKGGQWHVAVYSCPRL